MFWHRKVLQDIRENDPVERTVLEWKVRREVELVIQMLVLVEGVAPIDTDDVGDQRSIGRVERNLPATQIQQSASGIPLEAAIVQRCNTVGEQPRRDTNFSGISRRDEPAVLVDDIA